MSAQTRTVDHMFDLTIHPLVDGGFQLEQGGWPNEPDLINLHPVQVRLLAERAGLLAAPDPKLVIRLSARHVGRLRALVERLDDLRRLYVDEIIDHCGSGIEIALHLRALEDLAQEMIEDVGTEGGDGTAGSITSALPAPSNENSAAISVTPTTISVTPKRGRPKKGDALTPAERQRAHREKEAEAPRQDALPLRENVHA